MAEHGVSVVVPTLNRGGFLHDCLADLVAQRHRPLEVLVVDQSEAVSDDVARLIGRHGNVIVHHRVGFRGLPRARNYGWQHARYGAILFVDDDIRCGPDLASEHLRALRLPGVGLVAGGIDTPGRPPDLCRRPGAYRRWTATPLRGFAAEGEGDADHAAGCNFSAWRHALMTAGGVDEALGRGAALYEETDLCLRIRRAGFRVYFNGRARLTHLVAPEGGCRVDRVADYVHSLAHNRGIMIRRHGRWFHAPVALGCLAALGFAYARHYRVPGALAACLAGGLRGLRAGGRAPTCTVDVEGGRT
ncbi:MAG: glycosyltransferase family 2 protein [Isosphaeraceae bacterium]|nr:glycosyltransferase family 2 protein [Isosphaeraceae bacterium]